MIDITTRIMENDDDEKNVKYFDDMWRHKLVPHVLSNTDILKYGFMTKEQLEWIQNENKKVKITDVIEMDDNQRMDILSIAGFVNAIDHNNNITLDRFIPADIIWDETIPIEGIRFKTLGSGNEDALIDVRIFKEYIRGAHDEMMSRQADDESMTLWIIGSIGITAHPVGHPEMIEKYMTPIWMSKDSIYVLPLIGTTDKLLQYFDEMHSRYEPMEESFKDMDATFMVCLTTWYAVMLLLLNPVTKTFFSESRVIDELAAMKSNNKKGGKKTKLRYIRRLRMNDEALNKFVHRKNGERKTMIWHVAGHWVHRNGKVFFRKGYWKGPLKHLVDEYGYDPREREIVTGDNL